MQSLPPIRKSHDSNDGDINTIERADEESGLLGRVGTRIGKPVLPTHNFITRKKGFWGLLHGPEPPRVHAIRPILATLQRSPIRLLASRGASTKRLFAAILLVWLITFTLFLSAQLPIKDNKGEHVINLDCVDTLWRRNNECGIDGIDCRPFNHRTFAFRCPAKCIDVKILNPRHVGPVDVNYRPLVIGNGTYRGDSFICASAIHSGVINDATGGCGRVKLTGNQDNFASTKQHGIESISFDSHFPLAFSVTSDDSFRCSSDPRSALLPVSLLATIGLAIFSTSPLAFFPIFVLIFAHVAFVSDPPQASHWNTTVLPDHLSMFAKRLPPAIFIAIFMYRTTIKRTLSGITAQFEKAFLWLGGFWIGALSNYTFDWIPLSRLTAHDLQQQPGAKLALAIIVMLLVFIIAGQAYSFWLEGRVVRYLGLYGVFITAILLSLAIPGVNLRLHHYILALLLLPGTSLQTRSSLLYQGILLGLFVNGIARWDFDSVLQTSEALRGDAVLESRVPKSFPPTFDTTTGGSAAALFTWPRPVGTIDGISVLVNDVERSRVFNDDGEDWGKMQPWQWERPLNNRSDEYFRWAFLWNGRTLDYSNAGTLFANGTWQSEIVS
ncbi:hypothetical protein CC86DRAFT_327252 [Ophiobolus disseminans]|uniref:LCCL domain-containing protein n=1 Tax=Ophiobolus disseminans TaxID=1469910 RepID=A0A6A6ZUH2_9PLEO|nr:hypothetical protein CC86DRAFT_327252 [Ophiobolus disseminans]